MKKVIAVLIIFTFTGVVFAQDVDYGYPDDEMSILADDLEMMDPTLDVDMTEGVEDAAYMDDQGLMDFLDSDMP